MKKTFMILALLAIIPAALIMAEGIQEDSTPDYREPYGHMGPGGPGWDFDEAEEVSLTGRIMIEDDAMPVLKSGGKTYRLMFPYVLLDYVEIKNNDSISIEGFLVDRMDWAGEEDDNYVMITTAEIGGEIYDVREEMWSLMGPRGGRGGMYGRGYDEFGGPGMRGKRGPDGPDDWDRGNSRRGGGCCF